MNLKKHLPWLGALLPIANTQAETKPNVVIIYIDDMGIGDIGCYGGKFAPTPNIDRLAQDGLLLNQYYSCLLNTYQIPRDLSTYPMQSSA